MNTEIEHATAYKHWRVTQDPQGIVWLTIDRAAASANTINREVLFELEDILQQISSETQQISTTQRIKPIGVVIQSGKKSGFVAGADITEFKWFIKHRF